MRNSDYIILIIDDEEDILDFVSYNLKKEGYKVYTAKNGVEGIEMVKKTSPNLVIVDLMMPEMDGIETCQIIRDELNIVQPIITFLSSRSEDYSQIAGLKAGADDYISKPIRPRLLINKVESLLRRIPVEKKKESSIIIDREKYTVKIHGKDTILPKKEFELLDLLSSKPGKVYTREQIMNLIWGNETIVGERTIDVHIRKLREKLGNSYIRTVKGVGYTFKET